MLSRCIIIQTPQAEVFPFISGFYEIRGTFCAVAREARGFIIYCINRYILGVMRNIGKTTAVILPRSLRLLGFSVALSDLNVRRRGALAIVYGLGFQKRAVIIIKRDIVVKGFDRNGLF